MFLRRNITVSQQRERPSSLFARDSLCCLNGSLTSGTTHFVKSINSLSDNKNQWRNANFRKKKIRKKSLDANRHNRKKYYEHMLAQRFVHVQAKYAMYTCVYVCTVYGTVRTYSCPLGDFSLSDTASRFFIENTEPVNPSG